MNRALILRAKPRICWVTLQLFKPSGQLTQTPVSENGKAGFIVCLLLLLCALTHAAWAPWSLTSSPDARNRAPFAAADTAFNPAWTRFAAPNSDSTRWTQAVCYDPANDMFYMIGGTPNGNVGSNLNLCQRYDPRTDSWATMAPMPTPRGWIKGLYAWGMIYIIGGYSNQASPLDVTEVYDIAQNAWSTMAPCPIPTIAYQGAVYRDSLIYIMGGTQYAVNGLTDVQIYDVVTDQWTTGTSLLTPCDMGDACILRDTIYFAGGLNRDAWQADTMMRKGAIDPDDPTRISWSWGERLGTNRGNGPTVDLEDRVYWISGISGIQGTRKAYVYTPGNGAIDTIPSYPYAVSDCCWATSRTSPPEILGFHGYGAPDTGYFRLRLNDLVDVSPVELRAPAALVESGATITPSAVVRNFSGAAKGLRVKLCIDSGYTDYDSVYLQPGETASARFRPWTAVTPGQTQAACSTMLGGDGCPMNDILARSMIVYTVHVVIDSVYPRDEVYPEAAVPAARLRDTGSVDLALQAILSIMRDDTLPVYMSAESVFVAAESARTVVFDTLNPSPGRYLAWLVVRSNLRAAGDTFKWRIAVSESTQWAVWGPTPVAGAGQWQTAAGGQYQYYLGGQGCSTRIFRNDLTSRVWDTMSSLAPGISQGAAAIIGDTLYLHGGICSDSDGGINRLFKYGIAADSWTSDSGCSQHNWRPCMVALEGRLYYFGGGDWPNTLDVSAETWCYTSGGSPAWTRKADLITGRACAHAGVHDGKIYLAGGEDGSQEVRETEVYDPVADAWIQDPQEFPYPPETRYNGGAGCLDSIMFIYGGQSHGSIKNSVLEYDFRGRRWSVRPGYPHVDGVYFFQGDVNSIGQVLVFGLVVGNRQVAVYWPRGPTAVAEQECVQPLSPEPVSLAPCRPNPSHGEAVISYSLPWAATVKLGLYDASGRFVKTLDQGRKSAGRHTVAIRNPRSAIRIPAGVYLCRLETAQGSATRKLVVTGE